MTVKLRSDLFDLPNELFLSIFEYLSSTDLIDAFAKIDSDRINGLLKSFVWYLDLTKRSHCWITLNLNNVLDNYSVDNIRVEDRQIDSIPMNFYTSEMRSLEIISRNRRTDHLKESLGKLRQNLDRLKIRFIWPDGQDDIVEHLFQSDSSLEELHVHGRFLYFTNQQIEVSNQLKILSIELEDIQALLSLMNYLPRLEDLKVRRKKRTKERETIFFSFRGQIPRRRTYFSMPEFQRRE